MAPKGGHMMAQGWTYDVTAVDGTGRGGCNGTGVDTQWHKDEHIIAHGWTCHGTGGNIILIMAQRLGT